MYFNVWHPTRNDFVLFESKTAGLFMTSVLQLFESDRGATLKSVLFILTHDKQPGPILVSFLEC